jgi:uncharacterized protein (DUF433 family)
MESVLTQHISKTPGICGGKACIAGHRIRVMDVVVLHELRGLTPSEIVHQYPGITIADVHGALTYYFDNLDEIRSELRQDEEWAAWLQATIPSKIPRALRSKVDSRADAFLS